MVPQGVTATLFGLALLTYAARTYIRTFVVRQFFVEDGLLLFAIICLCVVTGLDLSNNQHLYDSLAVILHGLDLAILIKTLGDPRYFQTQQRSFSAMVVCYFPGKARIPLLLSQVDRLLSKVVYVVVVGSSNNATLLGWIHGS